MLKEVWGKLKQLENKLPEDYVPLDNLEKSEKVEELHKKYVEVRKQLLSHPNLALWPAESLGLEEIGYCIYLGMVAPYFIGVSLRSVKILGRTYTHGYINFRGRPVEIIVEGVKRKVCIIYVADENIEYLLHLQEVLEAVNNVLKWVKEYKKYEKNDENRY